jgi:hypothetical protein
VQNVGESGVDSGKEATKLRDTSEVSDEGVKGINEALISQTNTLRTDPNVTIERDLTVTMPATRSANWSPDCLSTISISSLLLWRGRALKASRPVLAVFKASVIAVRRGGMVVLSAEPLDVRAAAGGGKERERH